MGILSTYWVHAKSFSVPFEKGKSLRHETEGLSKTNSGESHLFRAATAAGITKRIGWHTFRHTFSTLMASLGVEGKVVQELMRHASFRTTMDSYTQAQDSLSAKRKSARPT